MNGCGRKQLLQTSLISNGIQLRNMKTLPYFTRECRHTIRKWRRVRLIQIQLEKGRTEGTDICSISKNNNIKNLYIIKAPDTLRLYKNSQTQTETTYTQRKSLSLYSNTLSVHIRMRAKLSSTM